MFTIRELQPDHTTWIAQIAAMLVENFAPQAWSTLDEALEEIHECLEEGKISRVAVDDVSGEAVGWIGASPRYGIHTWELHPLVVKADQHRRGIGRALVADLEAQVRQRGGATMIVSSDDQSGQTNLFGVDLYPNVLEKLATLQSTTHPYLFYQKCGYVVVGIIPDGEALGQPDIWLAKRLI